MNESYNFDPMTGEPVEKPAPAQPAEPVQKEKKTRTFTAKETVLAWVSALIGYLFCRTFWVWQKPVTGIVFTLCLFAFGFVFFGKQKRKARSTFYPVSSLILASALFFEASPVLLFFVFAYICVAFFLFCQTGSETALEGRAGQLYVFETVKALFVSPFKNIGATVRAIGANKSGKKIGKTLLIVLAGIGIAIVPTAVVMWLLSFDKGFTDILDRIRTAVFDKIFSHVWSLLFGVPIGMYIYAALYTSAHPTPDAFNGGNCEMIENKMKFAPALVGAVTIAPLLFLYGVFIAAQRNYYKAIFSATLPGAYTFAEFARDGFFRLCAVAAINALALICLRVFSKKTKSGKISPVVKILTTVLSLVTIVISGTAISQMIMYVSAYGLTRLRLYTLWFMALLILLFLVTILKQFIEKLPFAATSLVLFTLCFALLAVPDTDAIIARHNYDCYLNGTTNELDVDHLKTLSPSSIPVLCRIAENGSLPAEIRASALDGIGAYVSEKKHPNDLPTLLADKAFKALDRETQLKAAAKHDPFTPRIFLSEEKQGFSSNGVYYDLTVCQYDKKDESVFTNNPAFAALKSGEQTDAAAAQIERYVSACKEARKESILPFAAKDLEDEGRFYIASVAYDGIRTPSLYLYDRNNGTLVILHFA